MNYIKSSQAATLWGISVHRVQEYCKQGRIEGATRFGNSWMIPEHTPRPADGRRKETRLSHPENLPMPRRSPFLNMTDLYQIPGSAERVALSLRANPEAKELFQAQIAYCQGKLDKVYDDAHYFLNHHTGFYAVVGSGILLSFCAIWRGDARLWHEAKRHISTAPCKNDSDREILALSLAAADSSIFDFKTFPAWFEKGCFDLLLPDAHPAAKVFYGKLLYMVAYGVASKQHNVPGVQGLALMRIIPATLEPLISQAMVDKTIIPEIHLRLTCATAYHNAGDRESAVAHIDKAIALAQPDRLYGILAEHWRQLDLLLEDRLNLLIPDDVREIRDLAKQYTTGHARLRSAVRNRYIALNLTSREREVAKWVAFGFTSKEIAAKLHIAESTVKQAVLKVMQKTGLNDRNDFVYIL